MQIHLVNFCKDKQFFLIYPLDCRIRSKSRFQARPDAPTVQWLNASMPRCPQSPKAPKPPCPHARDGHTSRRVPLRPIHPIAALRPIAPRCAPLRRKRPCKVPLQKHSCESVLAKQRKKSPNARFGLPIIEIFSEIESLKITESLSGWRLWQLWQPVRDSSIPRSSTVPVP